MRALTPIPMVVMLAAGSGCAAANESSIENVASNTFVAPLASKEDVTQQIVEAGHDQLAAACEANPGASIRVFNPLASGDYADVACSAILDVDESVGKSSSPLKSGPGGEHIGHAQQTWSPFGLGCTLAVGAAALFTTYALCPRATNPQDSKYCGYVTSGGFTGLGVMCVFL
jgi:hypothetical protein